MTTNEENEDFGVIDQSIKIKNYKCFGNEPQGFEKIYPINIIIGKNNSGKSSLIDMMKKIIYTTTTDKSIIEITKKITAQDIAPNDIDFTALQVNDKVTLRIENNIISFLDSKFNRFNNYLNINHLRFRDKVIGLERLNADRDITPEPQHSEDSINEKGNGASSIIWNFLSVKGYDQNVIIKDLLNAINKIAMPDILFKDIRIKQESLPTGTVVEIYFEDENENWVALSQMGSGLKTIL